MRQQTLPGWLPLRRHSSGACSHSREKGRRRLPGRSELPVESVLEVYCPSKSYKPAGTANIQATSISTFKSNIFKM